MYGQVPRKKNPVRQLDGVALDAIFEDTSGGTSRTRKGLTECLSRLREGDVLHVHSFDRLAGNMKDLHKLVAAMTCRGITVCFHKENIEFTGRNSPTQMHLFHLLEAFAQVERACIKERQLEGIAQSKRQGKHIGRPSKLSKTDRKAILQRLCQGDAPAHIARDYGVSLASVYRVRLRAAGGKAGRETTAQRPRPEPGARKTAFSRETTRRMTGSAKRFQREMLKVRPDGAADAAPQTDRTRDGKKEADGGRWREGRALPDRCGQGDGRKARRRIPAGCGRRCPAFEVRGQGKQVCV